MPIINFNATQFVNDNNDQRYNPINTFCISHEEPVPFNNNAGYKCNLICFHGQGTLLIITCFANNVNDLNSGRFMTLNQNGIVIGGRTVSNAKKSAYYGTRNIVVNNAGVSINSNPVNNNEIQ